MIEAFFSSGRAVDLILAIMALEAAWLLWGTRAGSRWSLGQIVLTFGPGVCILIALRVALVGAGWWWIALALAASFPLHLLDLRRRNR